MSEGPLFFGVRHLSPAGAFHLRRLLDEVRPQLVLVEAPADLEPLLPDIVRSGTQPPIAMLAYTREPPVRSLLYPLAEYSPEYQAMLWAREHNVPCRFMDLPSDIFLALSACDVVEEEEADAEDDAEEAKDGVEEPAGEEETPDEAGPDGESGAGCVRNDRGRGRTARMSARRMSSSGSACWSTPPTAKTTGRARRPTAKSSACGRRPKTGTRAAISPKDASVRPICAGSWRRPWRRACPPDAWWW